MASSRRTNGENQGAGLRNTEIVVKKKRIRAIRDFVVIHPELPLRYKGGIIIPESADDEEGRAPRDVPFDARAPGDCFAPAVGPRAVGELAGEHVDICSRVRQFFADGRIDDAERAELKESCRGVRQPVFRPRRGRRAA